MKIISIGSANDYKTYLDNNQGKVNFGIVFCTTTFKDESLTNISLPCQPENINKGPNPTNMYFYTLIYNYTMAPSPFGQNFSVPVLFYVPVLQMKAAVDNGIMDYLGKKHQMPNPPHIDLTYSYMPLPPNRLIKTISLVPTIGAFYFALCPLITFVIFLTEIVREKEKFLR